MARRMADTLSPNTVPEGFDLYAGYINGARFAPSYPVLVERFGADRAISISTNGDVTVEADVYDVERGDYTPAQVPEILANFPEATIYCNRSDRLAIRGPVPRWWAATLDGTQQVAGAVAVQWIDRGDYDDSIVWDDSWFPTPPLLGDDMPLSQQDKDDVAQETANAVHQLLDEFWNNQFFPELAAIRSEVEEIKAKVGA